MRFTTVESGKHPVLVRLSYLVLISLASCAKADQPELFVADPNLHSDFAANLPATGSSLGLNYNIIQGQAIMEGDIMLGSVDANGALVRSFQARGVGVNNLFARWPDGIVAYERPTSSSDIQQTRVDEAIAHWAANSRLEFIERTSENADQHPNYIYFSSTSGCASYVGMRGGAQEVLISDGCSVGSVIHEIGHAIGLFHEHTRPDRDVFVTIDEDAIRPEALANFTKLSIAEATAYGDYDYDSIMHYGENFFAQSSDRPTILVNSAQEHNIGQRIALSPLDIAAANAMYATDLQLDTPITALTDQGLEIDLTVFNFGDLGVNDLELAMRFDDQTTWQVSPDSDWSCEVFSDSIELKCTLDNLLEQSESRLSTRAQLGNATEDSLSIRVVSRTLDNTPENNTYNDTGIEWESLSYVLEDYPEETAPEVAAATPEEESVQNAELETVSASAGSLQRSLLALLFAWVTMRVWVRRIQSTAGPTI